MAKRQNKKTELIDTENLDTYFKKRMYDIGIQDTAEHFFKVEVEFPGSSFKQPIFAETPEGNIVIHYPSLYGGPEVIANTEIPFTRMRYKPENQNGDLKYFQDKGSGLHVFLPPTLIEKWRNKEHIETLILTEGEFKAYTGSLNGLDIIGLGGKDSFRDEDKKNLHPDIVAIVRDCTVTNLMLLLDADTLQVKWAGPEDEPEKDLAKHLYSFFNTVVNFREVAKSGLGLKDCYFGHLKLNNLVVDEGRKAAKGLDDLYALQREENREARYITDDLLRLSASKAFFDIYNVGAMTPGKIRSLFWLNFYRGVPNAFYANNSELLKNHEFKFSGAIFQNSIEEGLKVIKQADSDLYVRVECDYYKMIHVPDPNGILQPTLVKWSPTEIKRDYGNAFFQQIDRYDAFCNVPCNTAEFEKTPHGCYNLYFPLTHTLEEGRWPVIEKFLKHVFGEKTLPSGHTNYDLILDYLTIMYRYPTQPLPIGTLYSPEGNTGKSTMLWLMEDIFMANYTEITNDILEDQMNDDWAIKLVIGMDEGFIEKNKVYQKLKSLSTNHKIKLRGMYKGRSTVPFFGKFWITTNDLGFIKLEKMETRFWINQVPVLTELDPEIRTKMQNEIPHFLYFLATREILHPKVSRHWFSPDLLVTEIGNKVKEVSKGWFEKELKAILQEKFFHFRWHTLYYTQEEMRELLNDRLSGAKFRSDDIKSQLNEKYKLFTKFGRWKHPKEPHEQNEIAVTEIKHKRCYEFRIETFIPEDEIRDQLCNKDADSYFFDLNEVIINRGSAPLKKDEDLPF